MKPHRLPALLIAALVTVVLPACGSEEERSASAGSGAAAAGAVTVTDDTGKRVELDAPAERVVTLEWDATENALALGVTPVGAGDTEIYREWVAAGAAIPEETESIGGRTEPSLEKIAAVRPDLIIAGRDGATKNRRKLEQIAPVVVFGGFVPPDEQTAPDAEWRRMTDQFTKTAKLLGREERAREVLADVERQIGEAKARIQADGRSGDTIALAQGFTDGKPTARLFDDGAMLIEVARRVGLENAFDGKRQEWGITAAGLEGMRQIGDADWLLTMAVPEDDPFRGAWGSNPAFRRLPVLERGHLRHIGGDTWTWGGPLSAALAARRFADAVTSER
jgi:ABC-type Fe3+-hydroxamate transport system substrate-binding protein